MCRLAQLREPIMSFVALQTAPADFGEMLVALAASEGSASHPYTHSYELNADPLATRKQCTRSLPLRSAPSPRFSAMELAARRI